MLNFQWQKIVRMQEIVILPRPVKLPFCMPRASRIFLVGCNISGFHNFLFFLPKWKNLMLKMHETSLMEAKFLQNSIFPFYDSSFLYVIV